MVAPLSWIPGPWSNGLRKWSSRQDSRFSIQQAPEGFTLLFVDGEVSLAWESKASIPAAQDAARSILGEPAEAVKLDHSRRNPKVVLGPLEVTPALTRDY